MTADLNAIEAVKQKLALMAMKNTAQEVPMQEKDQLSLPLTLAVCISNEANQDGVITGNRCEVHTAPRGEYAQCTAVATHINSWNQLRCYEHSCVRDFDLNSDQGKFHDKLREKEYE